MNIYQGTPDQINEFKEEMQKLMPVVELMKIKAAPDSLMGLERDQKLRILGYSESEVEKMCRPEPIDKERILQRVMELQKRELRILNKINRECGKAGPSSTEWPKNDFYFEEVERVGGDDPNAL